MNMRSISELERSVKYVGELMSCSEFKETINLLILLDGFELMLMLKSPVTSMLLSICWLKAWSSECSMCVV